MKIEPYELSDEWAAHAKTFSGGGSRTIDNSAIRFFDDDGFPLYFAVFGTRSTDELRPYWCDFVLFADASGTDTAGNVSEPRFDCGGQKSFPETTVDDGEADGFAKWDGCREVHGQAHVCGDAMFKDFMHALAATVMQASRLAGYEGDDKR